MVVSFHLQVTGANSSVACLIELNEACLTATRPKPKLLANLQLLKHFPVVQSLISRVNESSLDSFMKQLIGITRGFIAFKVDSRLVVAKCRCFLRC